MWEIPESDGKPPALTTLMPERVLDEYDGPRLFTVRSHEGHLFLAYQCGEDGQLERFLLVPADDAFVADIEQNRLSLREALVRRGWAWLVDRRRSGRITKPARVYPGDLPESALPTPGIRLHPGPQVLLRVRMIGEELTPGHVPASVVKRAVDGATGAVKALAYHALSLLPSAGRPAENFRRYYDLPAVEFAFQSFEIAFGMPESPDQLHVDERTTLDRMRELLTKGLCWAIAKNEQQLESTAEWSAIVDALAKLAPPHAGAVEAVDLSGMLAGQARGSVRLTRLATARINDARKRLSPERRMRTYEGFVREFDKDRFTFILRNTRGETVQNIRFSNDQYDDALLAFDTEKPVTVVAEEAPGSQLAELLSMTFTVSDDEESRPQEA